MILDFFELESYSNTNGNHVNVINELMTDRASQQFLGDIRFMIKMIMKRREENRIDNMYIAKRHGEYIGFISLSVIEDRFEVSIGLLPKFRGQSLAYLLTQDFVDHVLEMYPEIDGVYAKINPNNIASTKAAILTGFELDEDGRYIYRRVPKITK